MEDLKISVKQTAPGRWSIENLTDTELIAIREAITRTTLPGRRELQGLHELLQDTPIF